MLFPAGYLLDRFSHKRCYILFIYCMGFGVFTGLTPWMGNIIALLVTSFLYGLNSSSLDAGNIYWILSCYIYLWNTALITEISISVLRFWSPPPSPTPKHTSKMQKRSRWVISPLKCSVSLVFPSFWRIFLFYVQRFEIVRIWRSTFNIQCF